MYHCPCWYQGKPSFLRTPCCGSPHDESYDRWQLNCVAYSYPFSSTEGLYGCWVIETEPENWNLTGLWHELKKMNENNEFSGPVRMVSPPKWRNEESVFIVHTPCGNKEVVGRKLACIVQKSIHYVLNDFSHQYFPVYEHEIL